MSEFPGFWVCFLINVDGIICLEQALRIVRWQGNNNNRTVNGKLDRLLSANIAPGS